MDDLLTRLREARGADRELDAAIFRATGGQLPEQFASLKLDLEWQDDGTALMPVGDMQVRYQAPAFTSSVDAAIALIERVLPGWTVAHIGQDDFKLWHVELREGYQTSFTRVVRSHATLRGAPTPALALVIALVEAVKAQQQP